MAVDRKDTALPDAGTTYVGADLLRLAVDILGTPDSESISVTNFFGNIPVSVGVDNVNGIDINPGSDIDADIITVGVTGAPRIFWDESDSAFNIQPKVVIGGAVSSIWGGDLRVKADGNGVAILIEENSGTESWGMSVNSAGDFEFHDSGAGTVRVTLQDGGRVGILTGSPAAQLHVDQSSSSGAIPVLYLDQADVSEEMIEFASTIGVGNAIEAVGAKALTTTHFIKVTLPGALTRYFEVGTIA